VGLKRSGCTLQTVSKNEVGSLGGKQMLLTQELGATNFIAEIHKKLQDSLVLGWKSFRGSKDFKIYEKFFEYLLKAGFDESEYRKIIPNPAYDNAAKLIGKPFLQTARKLGIYFDEIFPGNFAESKELTKGNYEVRQFRLTAYFNNQPLCWFLLSFSHLHNELDFPYPPELKVEKLF
jgi:hypothetical protein